MENNMQKEFELPVTASRTCDVGWLIVEAYLDGLESSARELFGDIEYKNMFDGLRKYTNRKLYGCDEFNMVDIELTIYQEQEDTE